MCRYKVIETSDKGVQTVLDARERGVCSDTGGAWSRRLSATRSAISASVSTGTSPGATRTGTMLCATAALRGLAPSWASGPVGWVEEPAGPMRDGWGCVFFVGSPLTVGDNTRKIQPWQR
ncbi:hypothetical protein HPB50_025240 [Hyalomma asiaticum]|uniref:Uncharacterized protein n=1 Tax=Hyalomma asiaticum TaxID=266040 RepID=A0ACB7SKP6_HYAAI|nr:hypothetical protein HPB50_025240 [Hyalomma asiaticum]